MGGPTHRGGKEHPTTKGAGVFLPPHPPLKHKTESPPLSAQLYFYFILERNWDCFKRLKKKNASFISGAEPGKARYGFLLLGGTSVHLPKQRGHPRERREAKAGRHCSPRRADVHPLQEHARWSCFPGPPFGSNCPMPVECCSVPVAGHRE